MGSDKINPVNKLENDNYLIVISEFENLKKSDIKKSIQCKNNCNEQKRLWAIFGKVGSSEDWECVQVGSSNDIVGELRDILDMMISKPEEISISTYFHSDVYKFTTYSDKNSVKYRNIYQKYDKFIIYEIDVEKYLKNVNPNNYDKLNYAEVKFAYDNKALLWNPAPPTNGNKEKEILENCFNL